MLWPLSPSSPLKAAGWQKLSLIPIVRVLQGCLIITVQEPEQEPEVMRMLRKVCKLSARKQRQITEFIQVIATPGKRADKRG